MPKKLTHKEFLQKLNNNHSYKDFSIICEYINTETPIKIKHNICGYEFYRKPEKLLSRKINCPKCNQKARSNSEKRKTTDLFKEEVKKLVGDEYLILGEYINSKTKIDIKHLLCGFTWQMCPNSFLNGIRCPKCAKGGTLWNDDEFKGLVKLMVGDEYTFLEEYKNYDTKIEVLHTTCGYKYKVSPNKFLSNRRCPKCSLLIRAKKRMKNPQDFKKEFDENSDGEYLLLSEYKSYKAKISVKHISCGCEYLVTPNNFLNGTRCPKCSLSNGEKRISEILNESNVFYLKEMSFNDLTYKGKLRFDFYIKSKNNFLIEFDGIQHYVPQNFGGISNEEAQKNLTEQQIKDNLKNDFCKINKITLYRIPYYEYDNLNLIIKDILNKERSTTIPKGSTLQATGSGNGESVKYTVI